MIAKLKQVENFRRVANRVEENIRKQHLSDDARWSNVLGVLISIR